MLNDSAIASTKLLIYLEAAVKVAREAGAISKAAFLAPKLATSKTCAQDLVTETDHQIESLIKQRLINEQFPQHFFIGEETRSANDRDKGIPHEFTWIVDPIDGTTNFVNGFPHFAVSIGLCLGQQPVVGVVYNPVNEELFAAALGHGTTLNGQPIHTSAFTLDKCLADSLIITEFTTKDKARPVVEHVYQLMQHARSVRMTGSAALNMAWVAAGRAEAFVEQGIKSWDICAGTIILREAGGYVTDYHGTSQSFDLDKGEVISAASQKLAQQLVFLLGNSN